MRRRLSLVIGLVALLALLALFGSAWWKARQGSGVGSRLVSQPPPRAPLDARARARFAALVGQPAGDEEAVITGRVVRVDTGAGVAGATVVAGEGSEAATLSGPDGRFRLGGLRRGRWKPIAHARGLFGVAMASVWADVGHVSSDVTIAMHPAADIAARVELASSGEPCPGASVQLASPLGSWLTEIADDAGEVTFTLPRGRYGVRFHCPGNAPGEEAEAIEIGDEPLSLTFVVHDKLAIAGMVVDDAGEPASLVEIAASRKDGGEVASASTDRDGAFELFLEEPGKYELTASDWSGRVDVAPVMTSVPASGVRVVVRKSLHVKGRVVDERGEHVRSTVVATGASEAHQLTDEVDDDGRFDLSLAHPGQIHLDIDVAGTRLPVVSGDADPIVPVAGAITLVVSPPPQLRGTVVGASGPASHAVVHVSCPPDGARGGMTMTDGSGRFTVFVPDRECALFARNDLGETTEPQTFPSGADATLHLRASATLRGTVRPAPTMFFVRVSGRPGREESFFGTSGAWEMTGLGAGDSEVQILGDGWEGEAKVTLSPGQTQSIQVELKPRARQP